MKSGDAISGLIGWEYHNDPPADLPGLEVVATGIAWQGGGLEPLLASPRPGCPRPAHRRKPAAPGVEMNHSVVL